MYLYEFAHQKTTKTATESRITAAKARTHHKINFRSFSKIIGLKGSTGG